MIYIGLDVSSKSIVVHALDERKKVVFKGEVETSRKGLKGLFEQLPTDSYYFVLEAANQLKWIHDFYKKQANCRLHVVHPNEIKWITQSNAKCDKVDARKLAELARADALPTPVHVPVGKVRELRELVSARHLFQRKRVSFVNSIRGLLLQEGVRPATGFFKSGEWRALLEKMKISKNLKLIVEQMMMAHDALDACETEIESEMLAIEDKRIELLKTIPAIGDITSRVLLSALDNVERFENKKSITNYGALSPTHYQSGNVNHHGHVNRDGRIEVRAVLLQCAQTIARMKYSPSVAPLKDFFERIEKRRGKKRAVVAICRKLLTTAYGVLKTNKPYNPAQLRPSEAA